MKEACAPDRSHLKVLLRHRRPGEQLRFAGEDAGKDAGVLHLVEAPLPDVGDPLEHLRVDAGTQADDGDGHAVASHPLDDLAPVRRGDPVRQQDHVLLPGLRRTQILPCRLERREHLRAAAGLDAGDVALKACALLRRSQRHDPRGHLVEGDELDEIVVLERLDGPRHRLLGHLQRRSGHGARAVDDQGEGEGGCIARDRGLEHHRQERGEARPSPAGRVLAGGEEETAAALDVAGDGVLPRERHAIRRRIREDEEVEAREVLAALGDVGGAHGDDLEALAFQGIGQVLVARALDKEHRRGVHRSGRGRARRRRCRASARRDDEEREEEEEEPQHRGWLAAGA